MPSPLLDALTTRVLVADGAMGTMVQAADVAVHDFQGYEGCNEILNITRSDVVGAIHDAYLAVGADVITTNSFGANAGNLGDYGIPDRVRELSYASATIARACADRWSTPSRPRFVCGSMGPGTKLPTLGQTSYRALREAYEDNAAGLLDGGVDALIVETCQDILQAKAAVVAARRAMRDRDRCVPLICQVTVELSGTMLLGTEIGAALTALEPLGIDLIGLNCATGPAEMGEHLRYLSQHARVPLSVMPNAGLPMVVDGVAVYPLTPEELADALTRFVDEYGVAVVGGCCGTTPDHIAVVCQALSGRPIPVREKRLEPGLSSLYHHVPLVQDAGVLLVAERTNANGSRAFREMMVAADWDGCVDLARRQAQDGCHVLDVCVDYVGRDGVDDMRQIATRLATASTLPIMIDSTEPAVIEVGLESLGGRCVVNSVSFEDGDGPDSRYARIMSLVSEHGAAVVALTIDEDGQARTRDHKVAVASRLIDDLTQRWGLRPCDIFVDCLTFPIATGQEETRRDGVETVEAIGDIVRLYPGVNVVLGVSNISFGLNPAARRVLNSVFLHECQRSGLTSAIVHASKIVSVASIDPSHRQVAEDLIYDRRTPDSDPVARMVEMFADVHTSGGDVGGGEALADLPVQERLIRRIVDLHKVGVYEDIDEALAAGFSALSLINDVFVAGMRIVGERFGSGQTQLPFVLQSAEIVKSAVRYVEPYLDRDAQTEKGTIVLATVKGDVHDIGKNLVDIILSNNGYRVVNLGIKQSIGAILEAAQAHNADAIGMSGLLVKSTLVMKDNLAEMSARGVADRWPVLLGGAALNRGFVEDNLRSVYSGQVYYAKDAFEGLTLMDRVMGLCRHGVSPIDAEREAVLDQRRRLRQQRAVVRPGVEQVVSDSSFVGDAPVPSVPFLGARVVRGIALGDYASMVDERATIVGQWGFRAGDGRSREEIIEAEGRPRLRWWLDRFAVDQVLEAAVVYGYFPCYAEKDDLVVVDGSTGAERVRFPFPRQQTGRRLCIADFFRTAEHVHRSSEYDVVAFQIVTIGTKASDYTRDLFERDAYRDYVEAHGLSVQLTEALAEYWHARIRQEMVCADGGRLSDGDPSDLAGILKAHYVGRRYSFGYPACPDLEERAKIVDLLGADRIGVTVTDGYQLVPEQSTDAFIVHHPAACYFSV